jgi:hypothetical protein
MAKPPSEANKQIAQAVRAVFGGQQFKVINYLERTRSPRSTSCTAPRPPSRA